MDKVSVITVCYNAGRTIQKTIESVLQQNDSDYEYVVVDGASQDDTLEIVNFYAEQFRKEFIPITVVSEKDHGIYDAMNKAIDLASGDWIIFMNADDSFYSADVLQKVFSNDLTGIDVVYGDCVRLDGQGAYPMKANPPETLPKQMPFMHQAVFVRSELCKQYKFDLGHKLCADYDFFFRIYSLGYRFEKVDVTVCNYSIRGISGRALLDAQKEVIEIKKKHEAQYPISARDRVQWFVDAIKMKVKTLMPDDLMATLRHAKHRR